MTEVERRRALEEVATEVRACTRCRLHEGRTQAVPGEGHPSTEVLFVGEAPGLNEDRQGRPFVGAAGAFLTELLATVGWARDEVFITNVVKCRPPQNRDPEPDEIAACAPFLRRQLEVLDPAIVVTLGRYSMGTFMPGARIGQVHGTSRAVDPGTGARRALAFAMYHPAAALRTPALEQESFEDVARVPALLLRAREQRETADAANDAAAAAPAPSIQDPGAAAGPSPEPGTVPPEPVTRPAQPHQPPLVAGPAADPAADDAAQLTLF